MINTAVCVELIERTLELLLAVLSAVFGLGPLV